MSILMNMLAQVPEVAANEPNWMILGIIIGIIVILAIFLLIPLKPDKALGSEEPKKSLDDEDSKRKALPDDSDDKQLSLAEIKGAKRAAVSENKSKDEMRELRKERRAATQTANAIHEREEAAKRSEESEEVEEIEEPVSQEIDEVQDSTSSELLSEASGSEAEDSEKDKLTAPIDDILTNSEAGTSDVFASLFGNSVSDEGGLKFDGVVSETPNASDGSVFPTLGSKLIPLNELMAAAEEKDEPPINPLDELTKKLADKAEKKTLT